MTKYKISIQLTLEYLHKNTLTFAKHKEFNFETYKFIEPKTNISITIESNFKVIFAELIADNDDKAMIIVDNLLEEVCKKLTMIIQLQTAENEESQPSLSYDISKATINERIEVLNVCKENNTGTIICSEHIGFRDALFLTTTHTISLEKYDYIFSNESTLFMDILYRALRCRDVLSKYFTLFTMIEFIETKYSDDLETHKILSKANITKFKKWVNEELIIDDKAQKERLTNRINDILCKATIETRADKLCEIIKQKYNITSISKALINYDITPEKMNKFISMRNKIVHGSTTSDIENNVKIQITNELLFLCLKIIEFDTKIG